jgi:hypothetical protein
LKPLKHECCFGETELKQTGITLNPSNHYSPGRPLPPL